MNARLRRPARPLRRVDEPGHVPADLAVGLGVPDRPAQRIVSNLQGAAGQVPRERPQACLNVPGGQVPQRPLADLRQKRCQRIPVHLPRALRPAGQPVLKPVMGSTLDRIGPGRAQPGVQLLALLLQRLDDILLGPAADLVPPAPAIRAEALAENATPAAPAMPVVLTVGAGRALVIEDDAAPALGTLSHTHSVHGWFPLWFPDSLPSRSTYSLTWWAQLGSNQ